MSRIRLLFAPENVGIADRIRSALAASGYDASPDDGPAAAALVVWSPAARASQSILAAARAALARRALIPVALGKSPPPPSFEHVWPMDLSGWNGRDDDPRWRFVLDEVDLAVRRGGTVESGGSPSGASPAEPKAPARKATLTPAPQDDTPDLEDFFAEPAPYQTRTQPGPRVPAAAMLAGLGLLAVVGGGAYLAGRQGAVDPLAGAAGNSAPANPPVIAFVQPEDQPTDDLSDAADGAAAPAGANAAVMDEADRAEDPKFPKSPGLELDEQVSTEVTDDYLPPAEALREGASEEGDITLTTPAFPTADAPTGPNVEETAPPSPKSGSVTVASADAVPVGGEQGIPVFDPIADLASSATRAEEVETASFGRYFRDCVDCPDMAEIASEPSGPGAFAIGVREVTFAQWRACVAAGACPPIAAAPTPGGDALPVIKVSYADALSYVEWLSTKTGVRYRLPSEAEWDQASGGAPPDAAKANVTGPVVRQRTVPVGSFSPNAFGLYDTAGNVWEWTMACWQVSGEDDPCKTRVIKGGAFDTPIDVLKSADRAPAPVDSRRVNTGFRVARDLN